MRDACALVASLYKGDLDSSSLLIGLYSRPDEMAALCGSLAAIACAVLKTIDGIRSHILVSDGAVLPTVAEVLRSVMIKTSEDVVT
jgi:hypothetical protein